MADTKGSDRKPDILQEYNKFYTTGAFKYLRLLIHSVGATQFTYAAFYWKDFSRRETWGGKFRFLTYLDLILQGTYHSVALLNDLFGSNEINPEPVPIVRKVRDLILSALAFPISQNVCISFWAIYVYDRELIFPLSWRPFFPSWLNHVAHSNVAMFTIMDMLTCFRQYPKRRNGLFLSSIAVLSYVGWLLILRYYNGRWAYPMLNVLSTPLRCVMLSIFVGLNATFYLWGEFVNNIIWAPEFRLL